MTLVSTTLLGGVWDQTWHSGTHLTVPVMGSYHIIGKESNTIVEARIHDGTTILSGICSYIIRCMLSYDGILRRAWKINTVWESLAHRAAFELLAGILSQSGKISLINGNPPILFHRLWHVLSLKDLQRSAVGLIITDSLSSQNSRGNKYRHINGTSSSKQFTEWWTDANS